MKMEAPQHVVAVSGGKDSSAMALRLQELHPDREYLYVITPTGDELPDMQAHWERMEQMLGRPFLRLKPRNDPPSLVDLIDKMQATPNHFSRWCTRILKIEPIIDFFASLPAGSVQYVGLRADEEARTGLFGSEVPTRFPMRDWGWGINEVKQYLTDRNVCIPRRTDCARCYAQRLPEWLILWRDHPDIYAQAEAQEAEISRIRGKPCSFRNPNRDNWPAPLKDLRIEFEKGRVPRGMAKYEREATCRMCSL